MKKNNRMMMLKFESLVVSILLYWFSSVSSAEVKKCLHVASYHAEMDWTAEIDKGIKSRLSGKCEVSTFYLDTKRIQDRDLIRKKGFEAKALIEKMKPNVVIVSDDNAVTDVLIPHFKNAPIPFVFCGVNWSIDRYSLPFENTTGMIEVDPLSSLIVELLKIKKDTKMVVRVSANTETDRITFKHTKKYFDDSGIELKGIFADTFDDWKKGITDANAGSDFIYLGTYQGIKNYDTKAAGDFLNRNIKKPTFSTSPQLKNHSVFSIVKRPAEQGEWAGEAAARILAGEKPKAIAVVTNKDFIGYVHSDLIKKFPLKLSDPFVKKAVRVDDKSQ